MTSKNNNPFREEPEIVRDIKRIMEGKEPESTISEGGTKAALEDWMYSIPPAAVEALRPVMKIKNLTKRFAAITKTLKAHGFNSRFMGSMPANVVNDYYDTFFGESVEVNELTNLRTYNNAYPNSMLASSMNMDEATQTVIGKYRFTPFTEGSITGWTISIQGTGQVGYIQSPAKPNSKTTFSPYKVYRTKGASSPWELKMSALPGTETRIVSEKEIRFAPRQLLKAIAMWMDKYGKVMTEEVQTEETVSEAADLDGYWTDLNKMAENIRKESMNVKKMKDVQSYLLQIAGSLKIKHGQQRDFLEGLLFHLEGVRTKLMSPSKHGNMEIMRHLDMVIRELKKY